MFRFVCMVVCVCIVHFCTQVYWYVMGCVHVCGCGGISICVGVCGSQRSALDVFPQKLSTLFFEAETLTGSWRSTSHWDGLAIEPASHWDPASASLRMV